MFNRSIRGKLPSLNKEKLLDRHDEARKNEDVKKRYNKQYADKRRNVKNSNIAEGDCVLIRQAKNNKLTPNFKETPYKVIRRNRSRVTTENKDGHKITPNISHFKKMPSDCFESEDEDIDIRDNVGDDAAAQAEPRRSTRNCRQPERYRQPIPH